MTTASTELKQFKLMYEKSKAVGVNLTRVANGDDITYIINVGLVYECKVNGIAELRAFIKGYAIAKIGELTK